MVVGMLVLLRNGQACYNLNMKWDPEKAKKYMHKIGMEHIKDGLKLEGADLIYESNFGEGCLTKDSFIKVFKEVCCWEDDDLIHATFEAMYPAFI